jgi:hypothetical protein
MVTNTTIYIDNLDKGVTEVIAMFLAANRIPYTIMEKGDPVFGRKKQKSLLPPPPPPPSRFEGESERQFRKRQEKFVMDKAIGELYEH